MRRLNYSDPIPLSGHPRGHHFWWLPRSSYHFISTLPCPDQSLNYFIFPCPAHFYFIFQFPALFIAHIFPLTPGLPWGWGEREWEEYGEEQFDRRISLTFTLRDEVLWFNLCCPLQWVTFAMLYLCASFRFFYLLAPGAIQKLRNSNRVEELKEPYLVSFMRYVLIREDGAEIK